MCPFTRCGARLHFDSVPPRHSQSAVFGTQHCGWVPFLVHFPSPFFLHLGEAALYSSGGMATPLLAARASRAATVVRAPLRQQFRRARSAVAWSMAPLARTGPSSMVFGPRGSVASARRRVSTTTRPRSGNDRNNRNKRTQPSSGDAKGGSGSGPKDSNRAEVGNNRGAATPDASNGGSASNGHSAGASAGQQNGGVHANGYSAAVGDGAHAAGAEGAGGGTAAFSRVYEGGQQAASAVLGAEQVVMTRLHLENKNKFRATVAGVALVTVGTVAAFWDVCVCSVGCQRGCAAVAEAWVMVWAGHHALDDEGNNESHQRRDE